ncbi:MarR family transcriptional regulator [Herbiconiux sp. KACC 21604]|uniref:MarR family winged helix-turn-helix transcriptional regulator n=1 Tax=unclassified Herbiconiux TaxID=2618217 RepID=UPI001491D64B|nr:MarR family transcriptional regulator [Herbiconiux sp. SALV-R1]QJU52850.1 MarR family transcriptional regulator [Herbiconiux sp. SALV-R1]WPO87766.1 MarR family transcriptional regulator [Herbiconiux sp. KACC 21604]
MSTILPAAPPHPLAAELRQATLRLARRLRLEKADDELSDGQTSVLAYLDRSGAQSPAALSAFEHVSPPSMNRTLNSLQEAGYIDRTPSPDDRRMVSVSVTDAGRLVVNETRRRRDAWLEGRLDGLSADDRDVLGEAAAIIRKLLEA